MQADKDQWGQTADPKSDQGVAQVAQQQAEQVFTIWEELSKSEPEHQEAKQAKHVAEEELPEAAAGGKPSPCVQPDCPACQSEESSPRR